MSTEPVAIARAWVEAANRQDERRIAELSSVDIEIVGPRGSVRGIDVLREWLVRAGLTLESKRIFARGNAVVMEQHGRWRSVETGEVIGEAEVASRFEVHEGRVVSYERFDELDAALRSAGLGESDERAA